MFGIGLPEMLLILALALIVVGPDKLPELARSLAKGIMELKKTADGVREQLKEETGILEDVRPDLEDAAKNLKSHLLDHSEDGSPAYLVPHAAPDSADKNGEDSTNSSESDGDSDAVTAPPHQDFVDFTGIPPQKAHTATTKETDGGQPAVDHSETPAADDNK